MAPLSCCEQTQPRCPPTPARKDTGGGRTGTPTGSSWSSRLGLPCRLQNWTRRCGQLKEREADRAGGSRPSLWPGPGACTPSRLTGSWAVGSGLARLPPARPSALPQRRKLAASSAGTSPLATGHCGAAGTGVGGAEDGNLRRAPPPPFPPPTRARMRPLVHVCLASLRATTRPGSLFVHCKERWGCPCTWHALHRWLRGDFKKPD